MNAPKFDSELLRPIEYINEPDPRTIMFGKQLVDFHKDVSSINLIDGVPQEIVFQFEATKNLYLYGWFVWRFFTISEQQALACLELALHTRYSGIIPKKYFKKHKEPGLKALLEFAVDSKDIKNEEFETWRGIAINKARSRYEHNKLLEMRERGLDKIELNYDEVEVGDEDTSWNYIQMLNEALPEKRNVHAHGSNLVDMFHVPIGTIKVVSEIINQIYSSKPQS